MNDWKQQRDRAIAAQEGDALFGVHVAGESVPIVHVSRETLNRPAAGPPGSGWLGHRGQRRLRRKRRMRLRKLRGWR